ncbi:iron complex transport system permease protein [Paenibacillus algorifonticola]|uniref:Iron complex transport system permease protein n=1 Tax=Paenibacillus algorifonticola TaxID=684063 RepID=A0A1I2FJM4_9BACL|nr:iron ABC transporter permease [Paenibacillus algorifonticola]SFF05642.1 iron complex transport system permease protein [Paenibacillus algorifonticola]
MMKKIFKMKQKPHTFLLFLFLFILIIVSIVSNLKWGQAPISWRVLYEAVAYQGDSKAHLYIQTLRLPRTLTAFTVGVQLALAGLLTQLITRNPLASPHIFGINAGASLAVVLGLVAFAGLSLIQSMLLAFAGAAFGALLVWSLAGSQQKQHVQLALAGIAVHFLLSSLTEGIIILNQHSTDSMMFWLVGSVNSAGWAELRALLPFTITGLIATLLMLPSFKLLLLDDAVATGLGSRIMLVRSLGVLLVILLAGSAVAVCGPIGFLCLIVPHVARALMGGKLPLLIPFTALAGGCLLVSADFLSKFIAFPFESPVGIITAAIGGPFFIYLARRQGGKAR